MDISEQQQNYFCCYFIERILSCLSIPYIPEIIVFAYHRAFNIPVTVLRNGIVYGEHMRQEIVVTRFITNALLEKPLVVEGGTQTCDLKLNKNIGI